MDSEEYFSELVKPFEDRLLKLDKHINRASRPDRSTQVMAASNESSGEVRADKAETENLLRFSRK